MTIPTTVDKQNENVFIVGICSPIHYCVNAFLPHHKCTFAICSNCKNDYEEKENVRRGSNKRTRRAIHSFSKRTMDASDMKKALNKKYQNKIGEKAQVPDGECDEDYDHDYDNLKTTCDVSFFENSFLKQVKKTNRPFPTKCQQCNAEFRKN